MPERTRDQYVALATEDELLLQAQLEAEIPGIRFFAGEVWNSPTPQYAERLPEVPGPLVALWVPGATPPKALKPHPAGNGQWLGSMGSPLLELQRSSIRGVRMSIGRLVAGWNTKEDSPEAIANIRIAFRVLREVTPDRAYITNADRTLRGDLVGHVRIGRHAWEWCS